MEFQEPLFEIEPEWASEEEKRQEWATRTTPKLDGFFESRLKILSAFTFALPPLFTLSLTVKELADSFSDRLESILDRR